MRSATGVPLHDALMDRARLAGDPVSTASSWSRQQDALLMGGKVQAPAGYADHVVFLRPRAVRGCGTKALRRDLLGPGHPARARTGVPAFDREKCVHCGACLWNCAEPPDPAPSAVNLEFRAGAGGLHSAEN